ncbi:MAG: hypothetical protein HFH68_02035 [Lachnospiraceae bacterium]|nr:hypothetical protein [Lachnospiraceae bacterium]
MIRKPSELVIGYTNIGEDTILEELKDDFTIYYIVEALINLNKTAIVVKINECFGTVKEKRAMIRNLCKSYQNVSENYIICTEAYVSTEEFSTDKYYDPYSCHGQILPADKKPVPYTEVLGRERKMLTGLGFTSINTVVGYQFKDAMVYLNGMGKMLVNYWNLKKVHG